VASPDPEGFSIAAKVIGALAAIGLPIGGVYAWLERRFDKKADKHIVNSQFQAVQNELGTLRGTQAKIFDQMREDRGAAEQRHREVLMHLLDRK